MENEEKTIAIVIMITTGENNGVFCFYLYAITNTTIKLVLFQKKLRRDKIRVNKTIRVKAIVF